MDSTVTARVGLDLLGSDNAPEPEIGGIINFIQSEQATGCQIHCYGPQPILSKLPEDSRIIKKVSEKGIPMDLSPSLALRTYSGSTIDRGIQDLRNNNIDVFLSAGNTGAILAFSIRNLKRLNGIKRPGIAVILPESLRNIVMIDMGANADCQPQHLLGFARLGMALSKNLLGKSDPLVGLLNIGSEASKGDQLRKESYQLLENELGASFFGNIEAHEIFSSPVNVVVTDGFTGNVVLKLLEGTFGFIKKHLKMSFSRANTFQKAALALTKGLISDAFSDFAYQKYGGALLLGLEKPVIISHGRSDSEAIYNALVYAAEVARSEITAGFQVEPPPSNNSAEKDEGGRSTLF